MSKFETDEPSERLIDDVAAIMASMNAEERKQLAGHLGIPLKELEEVIANWKKQRQH